MFVRKLMLKRLAGPFRESRVLQMQYGFIKESHHRVGSDFDVFGSIASRISFIHGPAQTIAHLVSESVLAGNILPVKTQSHDCSKKFLESHRQIGAAVSRLVLVSRH